MIKYFILLLLPIIGIAQPTLTNDFVPSFGAQYDAQYIENPNFNPGPEGANQNWNFSDLQGQLEIHFNILNPNDTPESDEFPGASFVWNIVEFESFFYYSSNEDSISQMGTAVANDTETTFLVINSDLEDALQFPITFGTSYGYHTEYDNYLFGNLVSSGQRDGTLTADAFGTIITPYGTYENALRIKIVTTEFGFNATQYAWYVENSFIPILVYESSDNPEEVPSLYFSNIDQPLSSSETEINKSLDVFYSYETNSIKIRSHSNNLINSLGLFNINGELIQKYESDVSNYKALDFEFRLNNNLPNGIYFLRFNQNGNLRGHTLYICNQ